MHGRRILVAGVDRLWTGASSGTRRIVLGVVVLVALAGVAAFSLATGGSGATRPNILLILTDDQRSEGTMSVMPQTQQWFQAGGTQFPNTFVTTPECCPSRSSIFSGLYVHNHGVRGNDSSPNLDQ